MLFAPSRINFSAEKSHRGLLGIVLARETQSFMAQLNVAKIFQMPRQQKRVLLLPLI